MKKQTSVIFYILSVYVVLQFVWWGYHLIELTQELGSTRQVLSNRVAMIIGEGLVFFLILIAGLWRIQHSIKKELRLAERQKNFLLSVTHELKTPIAANKLFWQTLEKRTLTPEQTREIAQKALQENNRLELLIDNILNASRIENNALQIVREEIDLSSFLRDQIDRFHKRYQKEFIVANIEDGITIHSDKFLIETIINNLIENAIKYAGFDSGITLHLSKNQNTLHLAVSDQGPGVPNESKEQIFSRFYRAGNEETRSQKGTGLGLFISAEFARLLGGSIHYRMNEPKGSFFEVILRT
jgi:two-component system, OmpR family, phosphate regulon sensor histidine kinase PhoR